MKTNRELLEKAAKAAGLQIVGDVDRMICQPDHKTGGYVVLNERGGDSCWNPLTDDGDAFRLAVKLQIDLRIRCNQVMCDHLESASVREQSKPDPYAATRRAIVRAAAAIGEAMK